MSERHSKSSLYLTADALAILDRLALETGRTRSSIVSDALIFYSNFGVLGAVRQIVREELERALPGSKSRG
jgi:hypothetical protein